MPGDVIEPIALVQPAVVLDDLQEFLNQDRPFEGSKKVEAQLILDSALETVEALCGPLTPASVTERVAVRAGRGLLATWPVLDLTSAHLPTTTGALASGTTVLGVMATPAGELLVPQGATGAVDVVYRAGRDPVPASLRLAVLIIAKHLMGTQRAGGSANRSQPDAGSEVVAAGFAIPRRAVELMNAHRAPRIGAA